MNEKLWHEWRAKGIGASEAPVIYLGKIFASTKTKLYVKKREPGQPRLNTDENPDFRRGHTYEPLAAARFEKKTGIKAHYPKDDAERYGPRYCLTDPDYPHRRVSLDAICEDGWIQEIKSPRQISCDKIKAEGLKDYYQIQGAYQVAVAQKVGTFAWGPGECKGVRLVIWEPETADVIVFELPYDPELCELVTNAVDDFWLNHVLTGVPPFDTPPPQPVKIKGGKYTQVDSDAWTEASRQYAVAKDSLDAANARIDIAKEVVIEAMDTSNLERVQLPSGIKFIRGEQAGRKSYDMDLMKHENPSINFDRYIKQSNPFKTFRVFGANKIEREEEEQQMSGLAVELAHFVTGKLDVDLLFEAFDDLRSRTEMYTRMLRNEATTLEEQLKQAAKSCNDKMFGG